MNQSSWSLGVAGRFYGWKPSYLVRRRPRAWRGAEADSSSQRWARTTAPLRWVAIVLPVLFLLGLDLLVLVLFPQQLSTVPGFVAKYTAIVAAAAVFAYTMFAFVNRLQDRIVKQNRALSSLYDQSQRQNKNLSALLAVGKEATSSFDLDELLTDSLDTVVAVTTAEAAEVWLVEDGDQVAMRCHRGVDREVFLGSLRFRLGQGVPGMVAQTRKPVVVHDLASEPRFVRREVVEAGFRTFCAVPLRYQDHIAGVLAIAARPEEAMKDANEWRLLEGISEWLALAIVNAQLYHRVQDVAVLEERERIAREMHDGMAQLLGYINTQTIGVKKLLGSQRSAEAEEELAKMGDIARDLYADVREGILELRTAASHRGGLLKALRAYVDHFVEQTRIDVQLSADAEYTHMPPSVEVQLIRILQEALSNVRKHSEATEVNVKLETSEGTLCASVSDNGRGFDIDRLASRGWPRFGLQTMRERAEAVGGTLRIETTPGRGTHVTACVPLPS